MSDAECINDFIASFTVHDKFGWMNSEKSGSISIVSSRNGELIFESLPKVFIPDSVLQFQMSSRYELKMYDKINSTKIKTFKTVVMTLIRMHN